MLRFLILSYIYIFIDQIIINPRGLQIGPKRAREMWFMARFYNAAEAEKMGLVNTVVPVSSFAAPELIYIS